jgi:hypothetical protein
MTSAPLAPPGGVGQALRAIGVDQLVAGATVVHQLGVVPTVDARVGYRASDHRRRSWSSP